MLFLVCNVETTPCPPEAQAWVSLSDPALLADLGITSGQILYVLTWGFGVVLLGFLLGWVLGIAVGLIRKI